MSNTLVTHVQTFRNLKDQLSSIDSVGSIVVLLAGPLYSEHTQLWNKEIRYILKDASSNVIAFVVYLNLA